MFKRVIELFKSSDFFFFFYFSLATGFGHIAGTFPSKNSVSGYDLKKVTDKLKEREHIVSFKALSSGVRTWFLFAFT